MLILPYYRPNQSHKQYSALHNLKQTKKKAETELADEQAGFRAGRGTTDMPCTLQILIEKTDDISITNNTSDGYIVFIDYSKAFDNVSHCKLFEILAEMGFPPHLAILISLYKDQEAVIRWNSEHTQPFLIRKGVSPHLFILYTEEIMRDAEVGKYGINFKGKKISNLRSADDTALCTVPETRKNQ